MPLYEYECKKCHHRFEKIQTFAARHTKTCPKCGGPVEQMVSAPAIQFKGSGWYVNDYAKKPSAGASSSASSSESGGSDSKGDSVSKGDSASTKESKPKSESKESKSKEIKKAEKK